MLLALLAGLATAQVVPFPISVYPRLDVSPPSPVVGDTVALWYVKDVRPNACVPSYSNESVIVEQSPLAIWPPIYTVRLFYREWPHIVDTLCAQVQTEYGPRFSLLNVPIGNYTVMDGDSTVGSFSVTQGLGVSGMVTDDPGTTKRMTIPLRDVLVTIATPPMWYLMKVAGPILPPYQYYSDSTRTAADGAFRFAAVPQDYYQLTFSKSGYATQTIPLNLAKDTAGMLIKMVPEGTTGSVRGTVTRVICPFVPPCVAMPVPQCTVMVSFQDCSGGIVPMAGSFQGIRFCVSYTAVTDNLGRYVVDSLPLSRSGERIYVSVNKAGYGAQSVDTAMYYMIPTVVDFSLTWSGLAAGNGRASGQKAQAAVASYSSATNSITLRLPREQDVSLSFERRLPAGSSTVGLGAGSSAGIRIVHIHGAGLNETLRLGAAR
jgi:hypothetical protein